MEEEDDLRPDDIDTVAQINGSSHSGMRCPGCGREFTISGGHHLLILDMEYSDQMDLP